MNELLLHKILFMDSFILGIESSCDDTSAAVLKNNMVLSNVIASQKVHSDFGGVVPELASRAHQQNIIPVVHKALSDAGIKKEDLSAVAFTRGPGLLGSLLVGISFAKSFALSLGIPLVEADHLQSHILAHFILNNNPDGIPEFPFLCLTVSGGHTQIVLVRDYFDMTIMGKTIDDAAGETFDKAAKIMGLPYPGGPVIDKLASEGNPKAFVFPKPSMLDYDFSFSGLKTSILYFLRDQLKLQPNFIEQNKFDICASVQHTIIDILMQKLEKAAKDTGIKHLAIAGGVSANSALRLAMKERSASLGWKVYLPAFQYSTDNAAMIGISGYYKFINGMYADQTAAPYSRQMV